MKIEGYVQIGMKAPQIAAALGRDRTTIYKELRRGAYTRRTTDLIEYTSYSATIAQNDYRYKATAKGPCYKVGKDFQFVEFIEKKILEDGYSPAAALAAVKLEGQRFETNICVKTLYNYIDKKFFITLRNRHLLIKGKRKAKEGI